jgi:phosphoribosyl 1,2-cyclic phosphodiesterase
MIVRFWGVRGSLASPGPGTLHFGGNTSCVEVRCGRQVLVLDGGTGLRPLGDALRRQGIRRVSLLFSHVHWDHIQGFPFFVPAFDPAVSVVLMGGNALPQSLQEVMSRQMRPPNFPVRLEELGARLTYRELQPGRTVRRGAVAVDVIRLRHTDPSYGYRIRCGGRTLVYATDTEHPARGIDRKLADFCQGVDLLIYDAQFTPEEYEGKSDGRSRRGWGHSTAQAGARLALAADVGCLVLFHHDPSHDDDMIRRIEGSAQAIFPRTRAAFEGLALDLEGDPP